MQDSLDDIVVKIGDFMLLAPGRRGACCATTAEWEARATLSGVGGRLGAELRTLKRQVQHLQRWRGALLDSKLAPFNEAGPLTGPRAPKIRQDTAKVSSQGLSTLHLRRANCARAAADLCEPTRWHQSQELIFMKFNKMLAHALEPRPRLAHIPRALRAPH